MVFTEKNIMVKYLKSYEGIYSRDRALGHMYISICPTPISYFATYNHHMVT